MPNYITKWLIKIILNVVWLFLALALLFVACVIVVLQISTRATAKDPLQNIVHYESLVVVVGLAAVWLVFRCTGKVYTLLTTPPRPD
jgi:uncharacterized BrkB/YihY/UPF0761 family membrane protein